MAEPPFDCAQGRLDETQAGKLYDFNARFFTPVTGRFISPDSIVPNPADPQSLNRYSAMANNPLKFTDPTGHAQISETYESCGGACAGSGGYPGAFVGPVRPQLPKWSNPYRPNAFGFSVVPHQTAAQRAAASWQTKLNSWGVSGKSAELPSKNPAGQTQAPILGPSANGKGYSHNPLTQAGSHCGITGLPNCDYYTYTVGFYFVSVSLASDGKGNTFVSGGFQTGKAPYLSYYEGDIDDVTSNRAADPTDFLSGLSVNVSGGALVGYGETIVPKLTESHAIEHGVTSPTAGASLSMAILKFRRDGDVVLLPGIRDILLRIR